MHLDLQAMERDCAAGIPGQGECPGRSLHRTWDFVPLNPTPLRFGGAESGVGDLRQLKAVSQHL